jgi:sulfur-oxidizing protein SoxY
VIQTDFLHFFYNHLLFKKRIHMNTAPFSRRNALQAGLSASTTALLLNAGLIRTAQAQAASKPSFDAKTLKDALASLGAPPTDASAQIIITASDIAENGAVVPVGVVSNIPGTTDIYILVEKNPFPLSASFSIPTGTEPNVQTRVKMGQSSNIHAIIKANGKLYAAVKETKVTLGGCGG